MSEASAGDSSPERSPRKGKKEEEEEEGEPRDEI